MQKILFVCTSNIKRSPTAASLFSNCSDIETKSAGTHANPDNVQVSQSLVDWADKIFVMSEKDEEQLSFIKNNFSLGNTELYDLDIGDMYARDDKKLKVILIERASKYINLKSCLDYLVKNIGDSK